MGMTYFEQVTHKFRCMVRVMATWPSDVLDFCGLGAVGTFVYAVCLTLEDPTARLRALLYGEDAVYLILTSLKIVIEEMMPPLSLSVGWG